MVLGNKAYSRQQIVAHRGAPSQGRDHNSVRVSACWHSYPPSRRMTPPKIQAAKSKLIRKRRESIWLHYIFHLNHHQRQIVVQRIPLCEGRDVAPEIIANLSCAAAGMHTHRLQQSFGPKLIRVSIAGFRQSVRVPHHDVSRSQRNFLQRTIHLWRHSYRRARSMQPYRFAALTAKQPPRVLPTIHALHSPPAPIPFPNNHPATPPPP